MVLSSNKPSLFSRASRILNHSQTRESKLNRVLGFMDVVSFGVSSTVGSGIFVSIGLIAKHYSGPALPISFLVVIYASLLCAMCFAEFSCKINSSGMGYSYTYASYGELVAFCTGTVTFLSYCLGTAAVARGWSGYLGCFIRAATGFEIPDIFISYELNEWMSVSLLAPVLCTISAIVAIKGMKEGVLLNRLLVVVNISIMLLFIGYGLGAYGDESNFTPFTLPDSGWTGVLEGSGLAFFCLIGWDLTCSLSEEVKRPNRNLPNGIVASLTLVGALYCGVSIALCGMVPIPLIDEKAPVASAFLLHGDMVMYLVVSLAAVTVTTANVVTGSAGPPRVVYTMAQDGLLPSFLGKVSNGVPKNAAILCGILNVITSAFFDFKSLASVTSCLALIIYILVCGGVLLLRENAHRGGRSAARSDRRKTTILLLLFVASSLCVQFAVLGDRPWHAAAVVNAATAVVLIDHHRRHTKLPVLRDASAVLLPDAPIVGESSREKSDTTPFRCPAVPLVPLVAVWVNCFIVSSLGLRTLMGAGAVVAVAIIVYLTYGVRHSHLNVD